MWKCTFSLVVVKDPCGHVVNALSNGLASINLPPAKHRCNTKIVSRRHEHLYGPVDLPISSDGMGLSALKPLLRVSTSIRYDWLEVNANMFS